MHIINNPDWTLVVEIKWMAKPPNQSKIKCPVCDGVGHSKWEYSHYNDVSPCTQCMGSGVIRNPNICEEPPIPERFVEYMKNVISEYKEG